REQCCDDLVLTLGGGNAIAYARTLADLEELQHDYGTAVPALGIGGGELLARIRRIVDPAQTVALDPLPRSNGALLPLLVACAGAGRAASPHHGRTARAGAHRARACASRIRRATAACR